MVTRKILMGLVGFYGVLAFAQPLASQRFLETAAARVDVLGAAHQGLVGVDARQTRIVVYAPDDLRLPGATSVFVNGTYHASLIKGAYSDLCYKPGAIEIGARQIEVGQRPKDRPDTAFALQSGGGQTTYLRINEQNGRPILQAVAPEQALRELAGKRMQLHTISRVAQDCLEAPVPVVAAAPVVPPPEAPKRHTLAADTLFASARSDRAGMTPEGLASIDRLVGLINKEYARIDAMTIVGHADPLGNTALNDRLAQERAETIRQYLETNLQVRAPITAVGRGARELVVTTCSRERTPASRLCNQPNRRVDIEVSGIRR